MGALLDKPGVWQQEGKEEEEQKGEEWLLPTLVKPDLPLDRFGIKRLIRVAPYFNFETDVILSVTNPQRS